MPSRLIDIPCDDIFRHDRLGLEPAITSHTNALLARSPQAIAIDGHWGTGKSTFLALWAAYLRREGVKVVQFNPWKSFEADPFEALTKQILRQVDIPADEQGRSHKRLLAFLKDSAPTLARGGAKLIASLEPQLEDLAEPIGVAAELAQGSAGLGSAEGSAPKIQSPDAFAALLSSAAKSWSDRPIVVMVDELDRCSPEYAVEVLQLLEHVFHTDHVVFVVAVNQSELVHSIRSFYGDGFNAEGYLERFFDDVLPLPESKRVQYIEESMKAIGLANPDALLFLEASGLSLREIDKVVQIRDAPRVDPGGSSPTSGRVDRFVDCPDSSTGGISTIHGGGHRFRTSRSPMLSFRKEHVRVFVPKDRRVRMRLLSVWNKH